MDQGSITLLNIYIVLYITLTLHYKQTQMIFFTMIKYLNFIKQY